MDLLIGVAVVAASVCVCALPAVFVIIADRKTWPHQMRLMLAAHHSQLAFGPIGFSLLEATIVDVPHGDRPRYVVLRTHVRAPERFQLGERSGPEELDLLRYWQAEAIPVLLVQHRPDTVDVQGPTGVVQACRPLAA